MSEKRQTKVAEAADGDSNRGPKLDLRKDNYHVYLKPFDIADEVILKQMRFPGRPPVWIPMPPH